ncbi:MAG: DNA polymerase I [candidate division WOR-3 bacterium]|nr:DNA polymerase I [candidate division WOR-3 bacterium]
MNNSNTKPSKVYLIDGHSLAYRSYFAFIRNPLRNSKGVNTSATFGFTNSLKKIFNIFSPKYLAVVFDAGKETFRHRLYEEYKKERPQTPSDLVSQLPFIKEIVSAYGIKTFEIPGYEADDVLATMARKLSERGHKVFIITSDKDLFQLVNDNIFIYDVYKEILYDVQKTKEKFGVSEPSKVRDLLALAGDAIDNIPGVPGIGPKRAVEILTKYQSLDEALKKDERLKEYKDLILLSLNLATVKSDLPLRVSLKALQVKKWNIPRLIQLFKELEFSSFLKELASTHKIKSSLPTLSIDPQPQEIGNEFSFIFSSGELVCYRQNQIYRTKNFEEIKSLLELNTLKISHDIKNQMHLLAPYGIKIAPPYFDLKIVDWLIDSTRKRYELSDLLFRHFQIVFPKPDLEETVRYLFLLYKKLEPELIFHKLDKLYEELEMPTVAVLFNMEHRGVKVDLELFKQITEEIETEKEVLKKKIYKEVGFEFNLNSPKQLSEVLFEKLSLPKIKRTKTGFSTDSDTLSELALKFPIAKDILRFRELSKLQNTYLEPIANYVRPETQRIHCHFNQTQTATGRLSSSEPNLQNIPIKGSLGAKIREGFIADDGYLLISADYSQIELRILAYLTGDENLKQAFWDNKDIHVRTAANIFHKPESEVTEEERRTAKMVNYGLIYGLSSYGLAFALGITEEDAQNIIDEFLTTHYRVRDWQNEVIKQTKETGYGKTIWGRIRPFPGIYAQNRIIYEQTVRQAINHPIQGSAADIIKKAMCELDEVLSKRGFKKGLILQIHDELLLEIEADRAVEAEELIKQVMTKNYLGDVPLAVKIGRGKNWRTAHKENE